MDQMRTINAHYYYKEGPFKGIINRLEEQIEKWNAGTVSGSHRKYWVNKYESGSTHLKNVFSLFLYIHLCQSSHFFLLFKTFNIVFCPMGTQHLIFAIIFLQLSATLNGQSHTQNFPTTVEHVHQLPQADNLWVFLLTGQSNMAGRGFVEPQDTISSKRILTIDKTGQWIYAKEPLHFYEPKMAGLDCGISFGRQLLEAVPNNVTIAILPCAVGGSSIEQWLNDETHRDVQLLSNFKNKVDIAKKQGTIKGILWHQGESDANEKRIPNYVENLEKLTKQFRQIVGNDSLPIILGQLGRYAEPNKKRQQWRAINKIIRNYARKNAYTDVISSKGLNEKGDKVHFDGASQREMGKRFATQFLKTSKPTIQINHIP